ncbi:4'-phosphopantetheinyl transferase family protein [Pantanalinema rosaneae CENA516]|uniref:4'-phosphopantetheinyl transferase family protein n=1 Tax=Pantanalinema rosaneae TaxID=1620701 RepID=UPI003D6E5F97
MPITEPIWSSAPPTLTLPEHQVHVWRSSLQRSATEVAELAQTLSPDERQRAERFRFPIHQQRFIVGRGMLRSLLGRYLECDPAQVQFQYGAQGKPALPVTEGQPRLEFNLAHSDDLAVYAIAHTMPVGIDLEKIRAIADLLQLTQRWFAEPEHAAIQATPVAEQPVTFFQYWTCKEAILKARGQGVGELKLVEISFDHRNNDPVWLQPEPTPTDVWQLKLFTPAPEFVAAIAVNAEQLHVEFWQG